MKKKLFTILFIITCFNASATNYYFSASGNDGNSGTTIAAPWKTIAKFNSVFSTKLPGDLFLFNRGDEFYGKMIISRSGSAGSVITIGAYGSGAKPVITGFTDATAWTNLGGNIWETPSAISTVAYTNMVAVNGVNTAMGRTPNSGMYTYQSFTQVSPNYTITSSNLNSAITNWTGAEVALFNTTFTIERRTVTAHSGGTLTYVKGAADLNFQSANQGFIIQNDSRTLDAQNEWYYSPATKKLRIYSSSTPAGVQVATIDTLVYVSGRSYISFDNISFTGANIYGILLSNSPNITVTDCDFDFIGRDAIFGNVTGNSSNLLVENNTFNHISNTAINLYQQSFLSAIIRSNDIKNCGVIMGAGTDGRTGGQGLGNHGGIFALGAGSLVELNRVDSIGYIGIYFYGSNSTIQKNHVTNFCQILHDGGGIYTWNGGPGPALTNITVLDNIVSDCPQDIGIYLDDVANHVEIGRNSIANCGLAGIFIHTNYDINTHHNTVYNCGSGALGEAQLLISMSNLAVTISNLRVEDNIFFSKTATQLIGFLDYNERWLSVMISDRNYWARPIAQNTTIINSIQRTPAPSVGGFYNVAMWRTFTAGKGFPLDVNSSQSPATITNVNQLDYEYNATNAAVVKTLPPGVWIDVRSVSYSGTITLQPYSSAVLINTGASNIAPIADAGTDKNITLPVNFVTQVGSGTDPDGTISSYAWSRVSGPGTFTIASPNSAATNITNLIAGVYVFKLTVTDNLGSTGSDQVTITVSPANVSPTANAGSDQAVTLPTSAVTLSGSGADPDGSISSYLWTRISGPNTPTIVSAASATTSVTGLIAGTYVFRLTVNDNQSATGFDETQVIVSASANVAPTASAGTDQTIQLPLSGTTLLGSGNDPDGTISAYSWTKVSGGAATITSPASASTTVTGLVQGVYQFKLTVTDNGGLQGSDIMVVTVNPANISPTANAGTDQTITLPTSAVSLSGSAADLDGSVSSHLWTRISGTGGTITSAASYATTVTGLTAGIYVFRLTATDNLGATGFDELTVTVNAALNIAPSANAGSDQSITWPTNSTTLSGSGTDTDGTIAAYSWTKISGGAATITSSTSASTTLTGLAVGVYQFRLTVTDNSGATATDQVQVTLNQGAATVSVTNTTKVYTGSDLEPDISTTPAGLPTIRRYNGLSTLPRNAGLYAYSISNGDPNYSAPTEGGVFTITKQTVTINASDVTVNYDGLQHIVPATTTPSVPGLVITYDGSSTPSTAIGTHAVHITFVNSNYDAVPVDVTLTIVSNPAIIFISDTTKIYNGLAQGVTVTSPYTYDLTYNGSVTVPSLAGAYTVIATINDGIHVGADTAILTIAKRQAVLSWVQPQPKPYGAMLTTLDLNAVSDISGTFSYSYPVGTVLQIGVTGMTATFTPTDTSNFTDGTVSTTISVYGVNPFLDYFISSNGRFFFIEQ